MSDGTRNTAARALGLIGRLDRCRGDMSWRDVLGSTFTPHRHAEPVSTDWEAKCAQLLVDALGAYQAQATAELHGGRRAAATRGVTKLIRSINEYPPHEEWGSLQHGLHELQPRLELAAEWLSEVPDQSAGPVVSHLRDSVDELLREFTDASDVPFELRRFALHQLQETRSALDTYWLFGIDALRDVISSEGHGGGPGTVDVGEANKAHSGSVFGRFWPFPRRRITTEDQRPGKAAKTEALVRILWAASVFCVGIIVTVIIIMIVGA